MVLELTAKEVGHLEPHQFVDFLNHLVDAERDKLGISPIKVKTSSELAATDAGVDARIEDEERRADDRWIPPGLSVWQFRTGEKSTNPKELSGEVVKPGVLKALADGGYYRVAIATVCTAKMREKRELALQDAISKSRFNSNRVRLLTADELAKWASEHPSILLLP